MRRYVYRNHEACSPGTNARRETREPLEIDMNERPENEYHVRQTFQPMTAGWNDALEMTSTTTTYQHIFETVMFVSMVWTEESFDNSGLSLGYYDIFKSYFYVPRGIDLPSAELQQRGHSLYDRDTVHMRGVMEGDAYYQMRISELENRLRDLEETRTILPREEIRDIHAGRAEVAGRPIPAQYFDDNIFEVE